MEVHEWTLRFCRVAAGECKRVLCAIHGNVGRNTVTLPGLVQWDFSVHKQFQVRESQALQFRFEAFNFPNHPNWGKPDITKSSPAFGKIRSTRTNMREIQVALKYMF